MTRLGSGKGSKYRFEPDPIVIDGVMYIPTGNDDIFALYQLAVPFVTTA